MNNAPVPAWLEHCTSQGPRSPGPIIKARQRVAQSLLVAVHGSVGSGSGSGGGGGNGGTAAVASCAGSVMLSI